MENFSKVINPGNNNYGHMVFCKIVCKDGKLSISGVESPMRNGSCLGSAGQINMGYKHRNPADNDRRYDGCISDMAEFADGWDREKWLAFLDVWKVWHLNDLQAGCEHQRAAGWDKLPIDPEKPTTAYGKHFKGQNMDSWNLLCWVSPKEHPKGLLGKPCPVCGYKYGTAWLKVEVPEDILQWLADLPETQNNPAWV